MLGDEPPWRNALDHSSPSTGLPADTPPDDRSYEGPVGTVRIICPRDGRVNEQSGHTAPDLTVAGIPRWCADADSHGPFYDAGPARTRRSPRGPRSGAQQARTTAPGPSRSSYAYFGSEELSCHFAGQRPTGSDSVANLRSCDQLTTQPLHAALEARARTHARCRVFL
jgi:hypothetical protein